MPVAAVLVGETPCDAGGRKATRHFAMFEDVCRIIVIHERETNRPPKHTPGEREERASND
jgi:hypothetical protein